MPYTTTPPPGAELDDLYEIVDGQKVWPGVAEPESDVLYEVINGERKEVPRMGVLAATIATLLASHLNIFAWPRKLGFAVVEGMFSLGPNRSQRRPDLAFIVYAQMSTSLAGSTDPAVWEVVPNLAVEVVSPNNGASEMETKLLDYFTAGVQVVWVVYPLLRRIYAYQSPNQVQILTESDELDGGVAVPGFRLRIADLFALLEKPT